MNHEQINEATWTKKIKFIVEYRTSIDRFHAYIVKNNIFY